MGRDRFFYFVFYMEECGEIIVRLEEVGDGEEGGFGLLFGLIFGLFVILDK